MAIRDDFTASEVLAAADLNDTFGAKLDLAGGKVLQVVRATDTTDRSTTSTSLVDTNVNVTITPQRSTSAILLIFSCRESKNNNSSTEYRASIVMTDNSNNSISGTQNTLFGAVNIGAAGGTIGDQFVLIGYATPATTSAVTFKTRFSVINANCTLSLLNNSTPAQFYAIEVSA